MSSKREDENRRLLEELNRARQLMMKSSGTSNRAVECAAMRCDPRTVQLVNNLETHSTIFFLPTTSQYSNTILPVFPRFPS